MKQTTHHEIREAIRARIVAGDWALGQRIPDESDFAREYGCARTTVNRAIRALADAGLVERKRKGGTRVRPLPARQAQLTIPIIREQVEATGRDYAHRVLARETATPSPDVLESLHLARAGAMMRIETLHLADAQPFALEHRWVNLAVVPGFRDADLATLSANEWLVRNVPFSNGEVALSATIADVAQAGPLVVQPGDPLFTMHRRTWLEGAAITAMTLYYPAPYAFEFSL